MIAPKFIEKSKASYEETMKKSFSKSVENDQIKSAMNELANNKQELTKFLDEIKKFPKSLHSFSQGSNKIQRQWFSAEQAGFNT